MHSHGVLSCLSRVVLLWVNDHFNDFETNADLCEFLEKFEDLMEQEVTMWHSTLAVSISVMGWFVRVKKSLVNLSGAIFIVSKGKTEVKGKLWITTKLENITNFNDYERLQIQLCVSVLILFSNNKQKTVGDIKEILTSYFFAFGALWILAQSYK